MKFSTWPKYSREFSKVRQIVYHCKNRWHPRVTGNQCKSHIVRKIDYIYKRTLNIIFIRFRSIVIAGRVDV